LIMKAYEDFYDRVLNYFAPGHRILFNAWDHTGKDVLAHLSKAFSVSTKPSFEKLPLLPKVSGDRDNIKPNRLAHLHSIKRSEKSGSESKLLLTGMEASGVDAIASALRLLTLTKAFSTNLEWEEAVNGRITCPVCESMKRSLVRPEKPSFVFEEDFLGGAVAQVFMREFLTDQSMGRFILGVKSLKHWLRDVRCSFSTYSSSGSKKTLLRHNEARTMSPSLSEALGYLYGFDVSDYSHIEVSDYLLKRRYQDFVNSVSTFVPLDRILILDATASNAWEKLCFFLASVPTCTQGVIESRFPHIETC